MLLMTVTTRIRMPGRKGQIFIETKPHNPKVHTRWPASCHNSQHQTARHQKTSPAAQPGAPGNPTGQSGRPAGLVSWPRTHSGDRLRPGYSAGDPRPTFTRCRLPSTTQVGR